MKCSPYYCPDTARKLAGTVETASFLKNFFTFSSLPSTPVLLKLLPATDGIEANYLHPNELIRLNKYRLPKRRSEYLTGRICAKIAAMDYLNASLCPLPDMKQMEIFNSEQGHPVLVFEQTSSNAVPNISISHSGEYAAAIATRHRCGIDIQKHEKSLIKVKEKYCTDRESKILAEIKDDSSELERLALLWSAKEAIQKSYSIETVMPTFSKIQLQGRDERSDNNMLLYFTLPSKYCHGDSEIITVTTTTFMDYAIAVHARGSR